MSGSSDSISRYFEAVDVAFGALDRVFARDTRSAKRHNLVYHIAKQHLERLQNAFKCWELECLFADTFKIDRRESGLPVFKQVLELEQAVGMAASQLSELPTPERIRSEMLDLMLRYKQFPDALQRSMAERLYYEQVGKTDLFPTLTRPRLIRASLNKKTGRPFYVMHWATYDGIANLPMIYILVLEDSSDYAYRERPAPKRGPWEPREEPEEKPTFFPNKVLRNSFEAFVESHSAYSLNLTSIATAMDKDFPELHPKQLRRFVLGPFYAGGITAHNETVQGILDEVDDPQNNWLLTWVMQELHSQDVEKPKKSFWNQTPSREIFYINSEDLDCAQHGVSAMQRHALVPHEAFQAVFAKGKTEEIFGDYECHIASGNEIIRHV